MNLFVAPELFVGFDRKSILARGILVILLGALLAAVPLASLAVITMVIGWLFTITAVWVILGGAFNNERRLFWIIYGLLMGIFGIVMIQHPFWINYLLAWFLAIWFITGGVVAIWDAAQSKAGAGEKIVPIIFGLISMFIGYAFFTLPLASLAGMIWIGGLILILKGIMMITMSRIMAKHEKNNA